MTEPAVAAGAEAPAAEDAANVPEAQEAAPDQAAVDAPAAPANDRGDAPTGFTPGTPERPIRSFADDRLDREGFIRRLTAELIDAETNRATGITIGVTGPWGSGKSSIIHLMHAHITAEHADAIVVRFDPWLYSGVGDLVAHFVTELTATLAATPGDIDKTGEVAEAIVAYGDHLASPVSLAPYARETGIADPLDGGLSVLRGRAIEALDRLARPVVVLVDDLDRLADHDVQTMARLVGAALDFPSISYVLAYDVGRVIQALGSGAEEERRLHRGRSFLEKVVQLQLPLPAPLAGEIERLLLVELAALASQVSLPEGWREMSHFRELAAILTPAVLRNLRDVKRLIGTFRMLASMVGGEVDWVDLLGFCALMARAPGAVENIRRDPDKVVVDPGGATSPVRLSGAERRLADERLAEIIPPEERDDGVRQLMAKLFPNFSRDMMEPEIGADAICRTRCLLTTLRLGAAPTRYTRGRIEGFLAADAEEMRALLREAVGDGSLATFFARLGDVCLERADVDHERLWQCLAAAADARDAGPPDEATLALAPALADFFFDLVGRSDGFKARARGLLEAMIERRDVALTARILRRHVIAHGVLGNAAESEIVEMPLNPKETIQAVNRLAQTHREALLSDDFLARLSDPAALLNLADSRVWDDECRARINTTLDDAGQLDTLVALLHGGAKRLDPYALARLVDPAQIASRAKVRLADADFEAAPQGLRAAYQEAAGG